MILQWKRQSERLTILRWSVIFLVIQDFVVVAEQINRNSESEGRELLSKYNSCILHLQAFLWGYKN